MIGGAFDYDAALLEALRRVYGSELPLFLSAIERPSRRLYVRVNTLRIDPGSLLDSLRSRGIRVYRDEELPEALYFPVDGPYQVKDVGLRVVADKHASESVMLGANLYAPGIEDCDPEIKPGAVVSVVSPRGDVVAEGVAKMSCWDMKKRRRGLAVEVHRSIYRAPRLRELPEFSAGYFYPQSLPAMYTTYTLDPQPGEIVVDMCAAPGGKTGHIVEYARGLAYVIAFDHSQKKVKEMQREMERLGHLFAVEIWRTDSRYIDVDYPWLRPHRVLVDPPCTALGVRPKLYDRKSYRDVLASASYQKQFLRVATRIVKVGGVIVYSTCTVTIEENEEVIEDLIRGDPCLEVVDTGIRRGSRGVYGEFKDLYTRFHPHVHDVTGYFIAKIVRKC